MSGGAVFVISGLQAVGKTTVAGLLARSFEHGVHVGGDSIRAMVVSGRVDMAPDNPEGAAEQLMARYEAAVAVARVYHDAGLRSSSRTSSSGRWSCGFSSSYPGPRSIS